MWDKETQFTGMSGLAPSERIHPGSQPADHQDAIDRLDELSAELAHLRELHVALFDGMAEGVIFVDATGRCQFLNRSASDLLGWDNRELAGRAFHATFHHSDRNGNPVDDSNCAVAQALESGQRRESEEDIVWRKDRTIVPVNLIAQPVYGSGSISGALVIFTDIRRRKASDQARLAAESRLQTLVNEMPAVTFINSSGGDNQPLFISPQIEWLLGYTQEEWLADPTLTTNVLHPDDRERIARARRRAATTGGDFDEEYRMFARDGSLVWVQNRSRVVNDAEGNELYRIGITIDISELKRLEQHLEQQAYLDPVTGLRNRTWFIDRLRELTSQRTSAEPSSFAVIFFDIDDFKVVNDTLGHAAGDVLLRTIATRLSTMLPPGATVARLGGDEFTVLQEDIPDAAEPERLAWKIMECLHNPVSIGGRELVVGASIGIAIGGPGDADDPEHFLTAADLAMYDAKHRGKNTISVFEPRMSSSIWERMNTEVALRKAYENEEFVIHFQPIIDLRSGEIVELEALIRWEHPEYGLVEPNEFIGVAEQTGLIRQIGRWTLENAAGQIMRWRKELSAGGLRLAVNLSSVQYGHPGLYDEIVEVLDATGLPAEHLTLEITESHVLGDDESTMSTLASLRALGVRLAIDDFGTGFSSLRYLKRYPVDYLKIDRSFVAEIADNPHDLAIVKSVIAVAETLDLVVTAEGVETAEQLSVLRELGCDHVQGFHFSRPLPAGEMTGFLRRSRLGNA